MKTAPSVFVDISAMETVSYQLWFAVRYVHLASVTLLGGGAAMILGMCLRQSADHAPAMAIGAAHLYEWAFWTIIGVTVATGVSNLGLKGDGLMGPHTVWGTALTVKLVGVVLLLALSMIRTDFVVRCRASMNEASEGPAKAGPHAAGPRTRASATLGALYALTVTILFGALWIGLGLGHGRY